MMPAMELAKYIINKCMVDNKPINNLYLQYILYDITKRFLQDGIVIIWEDFVARYFGPVIEDVYYFYCGFGAMPITLTYSDVIEPSPSRKAIIDDIIIEKRSLDYWDLVDPFLKKGCAWDIVYNGRKYKENRIIPKELIAKKG